MRFQPVVRVQDAPVRGLEVHDAILGRAGRAHQRRGVRVAVRVAVAGNVAGGVAAVAVRVAVAPVGAVSEPIEGSPARRRMNLGRHPDACFAGGASSRKKKNRIEEGKTVSKTSSVRFQNRHPRVFRTGRPVEPPL